MLAVDVGNTNTRFARFSEGAAVSRSSLPTAALDPDRVAETLASLGDADPEGRIWIASVSPPAQEKLDKAAANLGMETRYITSSADAIIDHRLATPQTTGVDRLLAALAGEDYVVGKKKDYLVIQCGSAATVDLVEDGVFRGGFILPGPSLWLSALGRAAQLPDLSAEEIPWDDVQPGTSTRDALLRGLVSGLPGAVAKCARLLRGGNPRSAVVSGGWGGVMVRQLGFPAVHDPDLVLKGIARFSQKSRSH
ncbi:MAG: type III pantothenate kinase [Planctomycetota bacterium]|jgi:type III pantothenate kinase|nr:type III pantothenate kinase [Planctomycetota bacterium]